MNDSPATLKLDDEDPGRGSIRYNEASQRHFHGRDLDSAELLRLIRLSPFVTLYGKSGLGKSSMLQAGVLPAAARGALPAGVPAAGLHRKAPSSRRCRQALRLRQEIDAAGADATAAGPRREPVGLPAAARAADLEPDNYPLTPVLVFDQFEEVFSVAARPSM